MQAKTYRVSAILPSLDTALPVHACGHCKLVCTYLERQSRWVLARQTLGALLSYIDTPRVDISPAYTLVPRTHIPIYICNTRVLFLNY